MQTPDIIKNLLGMPLQRITRSYWAVKLNRGGDTAEWVSEARMSFDFRRGTHQPIDWMNDLVGTGDCKYIKELWLFCPPSKTSPLGNTARLPIEREMSAFQFKIATHDAPIIGAGIRTLQAHIIGRVEDDEGNCTCFAYDPVEDGLLTPETHVYDPKTGHMMTNEDGTPYYPLRTNVRHFGQRWHGGKLVDAMWRPSLAPLRVLAIDRLGVTL